MNNAAVPNARRLLAVGFFAIFAAGVGFSVRAGILIHWARAYDFTQTELGGITGGGLWGFGVIIILGSLFADKIGYGRLMFLALIMHILSAVLQLCTDQVYTGFGEGDSGRMAVNWTLTIAMVLFAVGNGTCEVVVNPMVATLFPNNKTHYLNILHAGWPGGMVVGGLMSYFMNKYGVHWLIQMSMFLIPVAIYAVLMLGQHMPRSEAHEAGVSFKTMLAEFAAPMLLLLLVIHAMVGYVELGSDSWMADILNRVMGPGGSGILLFTYTSSLMFVLRFFGGPIEHRLSPLGLLFASAVIAALGLTLFANAPASSLMLFILAATIYGIGKTFFWPTMLAVVSERFPRGGALTIGTVGGMGALSAGLLGAPGIGFKQDYYTVQKIKKTDVAAYDRCVENHPTSFLTFEVRALDVQKTQLLELHDAMEKDKGNKDLQYEFDARLKHDEELAHWWKTEIPFAKEDLPPINQARIVGGQMAFQMTAIVPAVMAVLYLMLILYFRMKGGYKRLGVETQQAEAAPASEL